MASQPGYNLVDGLYGTAPTRLLKRIVWADAATYTAGQCLIVNTSGTPGTGHVRTFKKSDANDTGLMGVVCAESKTLPTGGGTIEVIVGGKIDGATWGLTAKGAISVGDRVSSSSTSGAIKSVTTTPAAGNQSYGTCIDAFTDGLTDGVVEWDPVPNL